MKIVHCKYIEYLRRKNIHMKKHTLKNKKVIIGLMHEGNKTSANVHTSSLKIYI